MGGRRRRGTKGSREGPLGAVAGHSRGAPLHPLLPRPEGRKAGGGVVEELTWRGDERLKAPEEDAEEGVWGARLWRMRPLIILKSGCHSFTSLFSFSLLTRRSIQISDTFKQGS